MTAGLLIHISCTSHECAGEREMMLGLYECYVQAPLYVCETSVCVLREKPLDMFVLLSVFCLEGK